jgi:hypothetical protein
MLIIGSPGVKPEPEKAESVSILRTRFPLVYSSYSSIMDIV